MTVTNEPVHAPAESQPWYLRLRAREMWASLAIVVVWLAVLFDAVFGADIVTSDSSGSTARIPSAIVVALFAYLATRVVAKYGFGRQDQDAP